jgi:2-isopropylmalate synthase
LLHHGLGRDDEDKGAGAPVRVLALFSDGQERWGTVGVATDILQASVACIIDGLEWKLRGERKH